MSSIASRSWQRLAVELDGEVGRITLNRPAARNALDGTTATELEAALVELGGTARAIVIHVAGLRDDPVGMRAFIAQINRAFDAAEGCPVPVIAAVQGYALAGGFELMQ